MVRIRECPFCQSDAKGPHEINDKWGTYWNISCSNKKCRVQMYKDTKEMVTAAWNTRPKGD